MSCCNKFKDAIECHDIDVWGTVPDVSFHIYGHPSSADDGDGYIDDMTEQYEIQFCPFCGKRIEAAEPITPADACPDCGKSMMGDCLCAIEADDVLPEGE